MIDLTISGFHNSIQKGFLDPLHTFYDCIDGRLYMRLLKSINQDGRRLRTIDTFRELKQRMSRKYYSEVFLAQAQAMSYASARYPAYSLVMAEDLAEDWLATVDFHKRFARDHSLHQPLTAYIVAELLGYGNSQKSLRTPKGFLLDLSVDALFNKAEYILSYARDIGFPDSILSGSEQSRLFWKQCFYETALLAALFHDMGYPWQYLGRIGYSLGESVSILSPTVFDVQSVIQTYSNRLLLFPFHQYRLYRSGLPINVRERQEIMIDKAMSSHGLPGGIAFLSLNDAVRLYPNSSPMSKFYELSIEWAAMGIVMHDMLRVYQNKNPELRLDFERDPLSYIVSWADYLEEFNRPQVLFETDQSLSRLLYDYACNRVTVAIVDESVHITMYYEKESDRAVAGKFKVKETNDYFNSKTGYINMESLGIKEVVFVRK